MSNEPGSDSQLNTTLQTPLSESIQQLFSRLHSSDVEQFIHAYQLWTLHQQIDLLHLQIALTQQDLLLNEEQLHLAQPTAIELAALAQFQSSGVSDIELLDRMHARGESWLDNALQILEHCERLDMIQGDYTQWCEHALEGAYDWLSSIDDNDLSEAQPGSNHTADRGKSTQEENEADEQTRHLLLQKLFGENEATTPENDKIGPDIDDTDRTEQSQESEWINGEQEQAVTPDLSKNPDVEDLPQVPESELVEEEPIVNALEVETTERETNTEPTEEESLNHENLDSSAEKSEEDQQEEDSHNHENLDSSAEKSKEDQQTDNFTSVSASAPSPLQESLNESEEAEDQKAQDESEHTQIFEEPAEEIEHTESGEEQAERAKEAEETLKQTRSSKRNRLIHRFVGHIFPKG